MYLLDTNIWLERLLAQERSHEVGAFLSVIPARELLITDFSFHSIGVILNRLGQHEGFLRFVQDVFIDHGVSLVSLAPEKMPQVIGVMKAYGLDFDDAYQFVAAEMYEAVLVSFDSDFAQTPLGQVTPKDVLDRLQR